MSCAAAICIALLAALAIPFSLVGSAYVVRWLREPPQQPRPPLPPLTLLRPLKRGVPELREKLESLVQATGGADQIVIGVDAGSEEEALAGEVRAHFPGRDIVVVPCAPGAALNPKIAKLAQMEPHARHEHWLLSDSEAMLDAEFLAAFRGEWAASAADVLTAGYRFRDPRTWPQRLDAVATLLTLWPGLAIVRRHGTVRFTLGACTALRRSDLAAVGGWQAFGAELAEDNRLGAALAAAGKTIRLSTNVATLDSDPLSWRDFWRHQRRVSVTYRASNPAGFAAMVFTHIWPWCALLAILAPSGTLAILLPLGVLLPLLAIRIHAAHRLARALDFRVPWLPLLVPLATLVESACWFASWPTRSVWWGGRKWRVTFRGRLQSRSAIRPTTGHPPTLPLA